MIFYHILSSYHVHQTDPKGFVLDIDPSSIINQYLINRCYINWFIFL